MHTALRPYLTASVALVGAGVIATTPVSPPTQIDSAAVQLAASVQNPADVFGEVFGYAQQLVTDLVAAELSDPAPILTQFVDNQIASAQATGAVAVNGIANIAALATGFPDVVANAMAAGGLDQLPYAFAQAVAVQAFTFYAESAPQVQWILQRPLAVANALVPVLLASTTLPIYVGFNYVTQIPMSASAAVKNVVDAALTGDPVATINAAQDGLVQVAERTIDVVRASASATFEVRDAIRNVMQTQPAAPESALERTAAARPMLSTIASPTPERQSTGLRAIFGKSDKTRAAQAGLTAHREKTGSVLKSFVKKVKSSQKTSKRAHGGHRAPHKHAKHSGGAN